MFFDTKNFNVDNLVILHIKDYKNPFVRRRNEVLNFFAIYFGPIDLNVNGF